MAEGKDGMISTLGYEPWCCCVGVVTMSSRWRRERAMLIVLLCSTMRMLCESRSIT